MQRCPSALLNLCHWQMCGTGTISHHFTENIDNLLGKRTAESSWMNLAVCGGAYNGMNHCLLLILPSWTVWRLGSLFRAKDSLITSVAFVNVWLFWLGYFLMNAERQQQLNVCHWLSITSWMCDTVTGFHKSTMKCFIGSAGASASVGRPEPYLMCQWSNGHPLGQVKLIGAYLRQGEDRLRRKWAMVAAAYTKSCTPSWA